MPPAAPSPSMSVDPDQVPVDLYDDLPPYEDERVPMMTSSHPRSQELPPIDRRLRPPGLPRSPQLRLRLLHPCRFRASAVQLLQLPIPLSQPRKRGFAPRVGRMRFSTRLTICAPCSRRASETASLSRKCGSRGGSASKWRAQEKSGRSNIPMRPKGKTMDMKKMMKQAQRMQAELAQSAGRDPISGVRGYAGGGMVKAVATGDMAVKSISIDPEAVDPDDVEMLEDTVLAAVTRLCAVFPRKLAPLKHRDRGHEHPGLM